MAISGEIEKLERRWNDNPSGLMFAPLAEAYRKAGNHARALELLDHGLRVHPDYVPALIVRGRCHLETGAVSEAEAAFDQALARDPVNAIALRGLAEVCERTGRPGEAAARLELLLEVDRGDSEAREALDRVRLSAAAAADMPPPVPPAAVEDVLPASAEAEDVHVREPEGAGVEASLDDLLVEPEEGLDLMLEAPVADAGELDVENLSIDPMSADPVEAPRVPDRLPWEPAPEMPPIWGNIELAVQAPPEPVRSEPDGSQSPVPASAEPPVPESIGPEFQVPDASAPEAAAPEVSGVESVVPEATVSPVESMPAPEMSGEFQEAAPEAGAAWASWAPPAGPVLWTPAPAIEASPERPDEPVTSAAPASELAEPAAASEPPAMEMHVDEEPGPVPPESPEAIAAWPEIAAPEASVATEGEPPVPPAPEPELIVTESMAEVFLGQGHKTLALAVYRQLADRSPESASLKAAIARLEAELAPVTANEPPPARPAYRASETGGRSVADLLRDVLQASPPVAPSTVLPPAIEPAGEPTRPTTQSLSLSAVFGDEPAPLPPTEPRAPAEPSYDEFFGATPGAEVAAAAPARNLEGEDLRQFNDWLRGLKR